MINKIDFIVLTFLLLISSCKLSLLTKEITSNEINSYYPLTKGKKNYYLGEVGDTIVKKIKDQIKIINSIEYLIEEEKGLDNISPHYFYFRKDTLGNILFHQEGQEEDLFIPANPQVNFEWILKNKSWKYKVVSTNGKLKICDKTYSKLLVIREYDLEILDDLGIYYSYYKKGVGLIARKRNDVFWKKLLSQNCKTNYLSEEHITNENQCSYFLNYVVKEYWKLDTTGKNGFRLLAAEKLQKLECNFVGKKWEDVVELLGHPNSEYSYSDTTTLKSYKLTEYDYKYLDFRVDKNNIVIKVKFRTIDG